MSFRDLMTDDISRSNVVLVGIPYDKSTSIKSGASEAPKTLRELSEYLPPYTMLMNDIKPLKIYDDGDYKLEKMDESFESLSESLYKVLNNDKFTLFVGGDHAVAISTEKAFIKKAHELGKTPVLFHLDAHADICDFYDGSKLSHATPVKRAIDNGLDPNNTVLFGIRSYEDQEVEYLNNHKEIKIFNPEMINNHLDDVLKYISKYKSNDYMVHLSFDIDMIDPSYAPGTGTPEHFGVESNKALELILNIIKNFNCQTMDIVEISPALDVNDVTSWLGLKILYEIFYVLKEKNELWNM